MKNGTRRGRARALGWAALVALVPGVVAAVDVSVEVEIDPDSVALTFDQSMATWHDLGLPRVELEPEVPFERCVWYSDTELTCEFEDGQPAPNATSYLVHVPEFETQEGGVVPGRTVRADTPRPVLSAPAFLVEWSGETPRLYIRANQRVSATAVAQVLELTVDGQPVPVVLRPGERQGWIPAAFTLDLPQDVPRTGMLELSVAPGLVGDEGPLPGVQEEVLLRARLGEEPRAVAVACNPGRHVAVDAQADTTVRCLPGIVSLMFNRELDAASRAQFERQLPAEAQLLRWSSAIRRTSTAEDGAALALPSGQSAQLRIEDARARIRIDVADDLRTAEGRAIAGATVWVETGDHPPALRAPSALLLLADPAAPLPIAATNAPSGRTLEVAALGRSHGSAAIPVPHGSSNVAMPLDDRQTRRALRDGGWVRWTSPATGTDWRRRAQSLQIAAPQLDVIAIAAADEVLVWISDLETGDAVSDANAELMLQGAEGDAAGAADFAPVFVASARSDADGIARIKLPEGYLLDRQALARTEWFVRAEAGRGRTIRRAVLPLGSANRLALADPGSNHAWGVTDRPLYRAGDTVRFRLWQRADRAGQLAVPPPADLSDTLHLVSVDEDKLIRSWPASADASDGWIGEVVLPMHANDGVYCVTPFEGSYLTEEGACFFVGTYRAQDLWAEASAQDGVLREHDIFKIEISGGYYSGGPAAGVGLRSVSTMLTGLPLSRAYPEFAAFTFVDVMSEQARGGIPLRPVVPTESTDADGHLEIEVPIAFDAETIEPDQLPAFGQLQVAAELALDSREGTVSNAAAVRFTRHDAFVGLRVEPRWLDAHTPVEAEAVVIDADGAAVPGQVIDVEIDFLAGFRGEPQPQRIGACQLRGGVMQTCDFPRTRSGRYRLTARSGDAAPTELVQYVWSGDRAPPAALAPLLEVAQPPAEPGDPVEVVLRQVEVGRPVLFVVSRHGRMLSHVHARTRSSIGLFDLPLPPGIDGEVGVTAYLRSPSDASSDGHLPSPRAVETATATFEVPATNQAPVAISFEHAQVGPGERTSLSVHNLSDVPRSITVSVMGDALRALAGDYLEYSDPHGPFWLGDSYWRGARGTPSLHDFGSWNSGPEWRSPLDPLPEDPPVVFDDAVAPPPPAPPADMAVGEYAAQDLDRIQVTGSRIDLADIFHSGRGKLDAPTGPAGTGADGLVARLARVRGAFADTALWVADVRLEAGEQRSFDVTMPDNLTRWRAIAWSADDGDGFDMAEATIESGLPVEARLQAPVRMFPGDRARLAGNARHTTDDASSVEVALQASGAGSEAHFANTLELPARGQVPFFLEIAPLDPGTVEAVAAVRTGEGSDGVGARIEVSSVLVEGHRVQAGWVPEQGVVLGMPALPAGATEPQLQVDLLRGGAGLTDRWTHDLRDFPHRCWEQMLSRAVGAALALSRGDDSWPDAEAAIHEALDNAAVFQDHQGAFHFFAGTINAGWSFTEERRNVALTAYSLRALEMLDELGHVPPAHVVESGQQFLVASLRWSASQKHQSDVAFASEGVAVPEAAREMIWQEWDSLALPARIAATRGMVRSDDPKVAEAYRLLLEDAPRRGARRVVTPKGDWSRWMGSAMREQCALIDLLQGVPDLQVERSELIAGLTDLFAGGIEGTDTQSSATCLMALRDVAATRGAAIQADLQAGDSLTRLQVAPDADRTRWEGSADDIGHLRLTPLTPELASSYVAELRFQEDARQAQPSAVGLNIERRYDVLRNGAWTPAGEDTLRESDWVRVTLVVSTSAVRHFVALTDSVPGGLQPTDLRLSGVGGLDLQSLSDTGSGWFTTRRLDPRSPRFYAERLPPGRHEVHYFARVGNAGEYLAAPATAELMYGNASRARTAAQHVRILTEPGNSER